MWTTSPSSGTSEDSLRTLLTPKWAREQRTVGLIRMSRPSQKDLHSSLLAFGPVPPAGSQRLVLAPRRNY